MQLLCIVAYESTEHTFLEGIVPCGYWRMSGKE